MGVLMCRACVLGCVGIEHHEGPLLCDQITMATLAATSETVSTTGVSNVTSLSSQRQN